MYRENIDKLMCTETCPCDKSLTDYVSDGKIDEAKSPWSSQNLNLNEAYKGSRENSPLVWDFGSKTYKTYLDCLNKELIPNKKVM